jgi:methyl-accepting chemotaxis protein
MDFDDAIAKHALWKSTFSVAIATGDELDVEVIASDNCCSLGRWLHSDAAGVINDHRTRMVCVAAHLNFHREAARVARLINSERLDDASQLLGEGSPFAEASAEIINLLRAIQAAA